MSLKIKIQKQGFTSDSRPSKRRVQRIESDDEGDESHAYGASNDASAEGSRRKKTRRASLDSSREERDVDAEGEVDVDIENDGDIEDTRFLPEPQAVASRSLSPAAGVKRRPSNSAVSSSKVRPRDSKSSKSKSSSKKPRRQVVWTDDEDEEFDDPDVVVTDDDNFDPDPDFSSSKKGAKSKGAKAGVGKAVGKSKSGREKEEKEITFRDERKLLPSVPESSRRPEGTKSTPVPPIDPTDEVKLQKRKLPPIKKNKPPTAGSTAPSTPSATKPIPAVSEKKDTLIPAPTSNQVGQRKPAGASTDLNLLDSSVYSELFKSTVCGPGASTPDSGLNRKQREEERRRELNRMREEARAKREAEARNSFDLQAAPEKIERFVLLRLRHSTARYPNVLGAAFKEMYDRNRASAPAAEQR
ncbi:hypothetical protein BD414DRAFT_484860 [Trametes punicea]|nr:hypothetical protein BD414DRAFT_484860 [Trametes punicea]